MARIKILALNTIVAFVFQEFKTNKKERSLLISLFVFLTLLSDSKAYLGENIQVSQVH